MGIKLKNKRSAAGLKLSADKAIIMREICRENDIGKISVFGSRARGDHKRGSDIDLLVKFKKTKGLLELLSLELKLEKLFGMKVEIVTEGSVPVFLKRAIMKEAIPVL
ncbi:MAG: nucleotidyltransferase domain-containing protein [Candidatus Omnitrophota bacterium]|nr:nucleotidyltransferase domain-containing protein [Candidatus Omnitrophota bacterium]MBU3930448.1 nucleotidyltransferase domain-containing protein [bacterium]MBU4122567.1 nucleotidyltransferase domain-containing protein [bacterium]